MCIAYNYFFVKTNHSLKFREEIHKSSKVILNMLNILNINFIAIFIFYDDIQLVITFKNG